jgi:hypothetical protein
LWVFAPVAAKLAIVLAVLHALLEVHLIIAALSIVAAFLIVAPLCRKRGGPARRVECGHAIPRPTPIGTVLDFDL